MQKGKKEESHFYKATCLVQLVLNLAAFANFNHLPQNFICGSETKTEMLLI